MVRVHRPKRFSRSPASSALANLVAWRIVSLLAASERADVQLANLLVQTGVPGTSGGTRGGNATRQEGPVESRAKAMGHGIHPMLIVFPLGLLATAVIFDILYLITDRAGFQISAAYAIGAGVIGGLVAAVFGFTDWLAIPPGTRAKRIGAVHGIGNVIVVLLFAASWLVRASAQNWEPNALALILSFAGIALALVTSWLGGELVERLGVSVSEGAGVNAPSSLSQRARRGAPARGA
ncbi:MAG TPA: DUF2231 domain-containing protein [Jiangellales bacterium]|nr:DUF2231 domain-containing protein [Jiangellales bacterium]